AHRGRHAHHCRRCGAAHAAQSVARTTVRTNCLTDGLRPPRRCHPSTEGAEHEAQTVRPRQAAEVGLYDATGEVRHVGIVDGHVHHDGTAALGDTRSLVDDVGDLDVAVEAQVLHAHPGAQLLEVVVGQLARALSA